MSGAFQVSGCWVETRFNALWVHLAYSGIMSGTIVVFALNSYDLLKMPHGG